MKQLAAEGGVQLGAHARLASEVVENLQDVRQIGLAIAKGEPVPVENRDALRTLVGRFARRTARAYTSRRRRA